MLSLFSLSAQAVAPLCQGVFFGAEIENTMAPMIRDLAQMKLQIDSLKVAKDTSSSFMLGTLSDRYPKLLAKLIEHGSYSESHIKALIRREIQHLQGRQEEVLAEEKAKESARRATEHEAILAPLYEMEKESLSANQTAIFAKDNAFYMDGAGKMMFVANGSFKLTYFNGQSGISVPAEAMTPAINGSAVYMKRNKLLLTVNSESGRLTSTAEISLVSDQSISMEFNSMQLNNDGSLLLMKGTHDGINSVLSVLDVSKKKEIFFNEKINMEQITDATFVDNNTLAVVNSKELRLIEISTGAEVFKRELNLPGSSLDKPTQIHLSSDQQHLIIANDQAIQSLDVNNLADNGVTRADLSEFKRRRIQTIANMPDSFIEVNGSGARIINATTLTVEFKFKNKYQSHENKAMAIAPTLDGEKIIVIYWPDPAERMNVRADVWKKY